MIIGHGDIASLLVDRPDRLFFAAGVSNSRETREGEYARECGLLLEQDRTQHIVYFSSLSIFYAQGRYQQHKRFIESVIRGQFKRYCIVRLGNITWGTNPCTLINHLRARAAEGMPLDIQDTYRHVIGPLEFAYWLSLIPSWSCELNAPGRFMTVAEIVREYVSPGWPATQPTQEMIDDWVPLSEVMAKILLANAGLGT